MLCKFFKGTRAVVLTQCLDEYRFGAILGHIQLSIMLLLLFGRSIFVLCIFPPFSAVLATYFPVTVCGLGWKRALEKLDKVYSIHPGPFPRLKWRGCPRQCHACHNVPRTENTRFWPPRAIHLPDIVSLRSFLFSVFHLQAKMVYFAPVLKYIQIGLVLPI